MTTDSAMFPAIPRQTIRDLAGSLIREVANAGMGRSDIVPFWFGESDQPTPAFIREAAVQSLQAGETFYAQNLGRPYLREAISDYLTGLHGRSIAPERIAVVGSGVSGLMLAMQSIISPGDRIVAVTPLWPNIVEIPRILGASVTRVPLDVANGRWSLDVEKLIAALTPETRLCIINSPNNPTGWTIEPTALAAVLAHCRKHGIWLLGDDVYERLVHDAAIKSAPSVLALAEADDRVISVNSFSKSWSMTGWRIGWVVAPEAVVSDLTKVIEYNTSCILEPIQRAATVALQAGEGEVAHLRSHLRTARGLLVDALKTMPGTIVPDAGGAMYVFFRIEGQGDSIALAKRLVAEAGLGLAPGAAFGPEGEGWLRWCHAVAEPRLRDGIDRMARFLAGA